MAKSLKSVKQVVSALRSTNGAGYDFEDRVSAWLLTQMLTGERAPGIDAVGSILQAQTESIGWRIDDLLLSTGSNGHSGRLAISVKGNIQVSASGLPPDFVTRAWDQWLTTQGPMNREIDCLALVTLGTNEKFQATWREVKNACSGSDLALAVSRIRSNNSQSKVFDSVHTTSGGITPYENETAELIRRLHVIPLDFQMPYSKDRNDALTKCRKILASGNDSEAERLWETLIGIAKNVRLGKGTITLQDLWANLRNTFPLAHHIHYRHDWQMLRNITTDIRLRIQTKLPSGFSIPRSEEKAKLEKAILENPITVILGESGVGKSAFVKELLDSHYKEHSQVWFGPEGLSTALSSVNRGRLPLQHELITVLDAAVETKNVLVVDSAERINPLEFIACSELIRKLTSPAHQNISSVWSVVLITQNGFDSFGQIVNGLGATVIELGLLEKAEVISALHDSPPFSWLASHEETVSALLNIKTLAWLLAMDTTIISGGALSHTDIADLLWDYWTERNLNHQKMLMNFAKREASFERSFKITDLDNAEANALSPIPEKLPLRLNHSNRIEFEHDLAADWARFQFLKQSWQETAEWAVLAQNPFWTNALRMLSQFLLRQREDSLIAWDVVLKSVKLNEHPLAIDILLDGLCLDPQAEQFMAARADLLFANNAAYLRKLLVRFRHIGTTPIDTSAKTEAWLGLYLETRHRSVIIGRWLPVLNFLTTHKDRLEGLILPPLATVIETWLTGTIREFKNGTKMPYRCELTQIALSMARAIQIEKASGSFFSNFDSVLYNAVLAGTADMPEEVGKWALELAGRRPISEEVNVKLAEVKLQQIKKHNERMRSDPGCRAKIETRRTFPSSLSSFREDGEPWPLGPNNKVDEDFRNVCLKNGLPALMAARPEIAAEVLLALIIENRTERNTDRYEIELGLNYAQDSYPTAFWKSPFFQFFQIAPDHALTSLIELTNFCTERWISGAISSTEDSVPSILLSMGDGEQRTYKGWHQVYSWIQSNSMHNGNLLCALDALERWLKALLDNECNISKYIDQLMMQGNSIAFISILVNIGKYRPVLLKKELAPLLTHPYLIYWDSGRVKNIGFSFDSFNWIREGEIVFELARDWAFAPHRQRTLSSVLIDGLKDDQQIADQLKAVTRKWTIPEDRASSLYLKLLQANLDRDNYQNIGDESGATTLDFVCPQELVVERHSLQIEAAEPYLYRNVINYCENLLDTNKYLTVDESIELYSRLKNAKTDSHEDVEGQKTAVVAIASTLIVLAQNWLVNTPEANEYSLNILESIIDEIASTSEEVRAARVGHGRIELKFAAFAAMHLWMRKDESAALWEPSILKLITSGNKNAQRAIIDIAYVNRQQLGSAWWRILQVGALWSALTLLAPELRSEKDSAFCWNIWLARLRRSPIRGTVADIEALRLKRIAVGCARLTYRRELRLYKLGNSFNYREPNLESNIRLDWDCLEIQFNWLLEGSGAGKWETDFEIVSKLWKCKVKAAKARAKEDTGEYDLFQSFGYKLVGKAAALTFTAPSAEKAKKLWLRIIEHGPKAHYILQHYIKCLFHSITGETNPQKFETIWQDIIEYCLATEWEKQRLWYYGERLIGDILGFGSEAYLQRLLPNLPIRMHGLYERWAKFYLHQEESTRRFSYFLITEFGSPLRGNGLILIAGMLKDSKPGKYWYRNGAGDALVELINTALTCDIQPLRENIRAREALIEITALLASENIQKSLALQERARHLK